MGLLKKENICISEAYTDSQGNEKKLWKTIGEIVTFSGNDGPFQKVKLWGSSGFVDCSVFEQDKKDAPAPQQGGYQQQAPQQPHMNQAAQQQYSQQAPQEGYDPQQPPQTYGQKPPF